MGTTRVIASIPPQPTCLELNKKWLRTSPLHLSGCADRVVYGCSTGVVVRRVPGEVLLGGQAQVVLRGVAKRPITCATCSRNGRLVVGGDNDGYVHVWLQENANKVNYQVYKLDDMRYVHLTDIALSAHTRRVVAVGYDKHSKVHGAVIQADTGSRIGYIRGHENTAGISCGISSVTMSPRKPYNIVSAGFDGRLCLHAGPPYKMVKSVETGSSSLTCVRYSPDGSMLAVLGTEGYMAVFNEELELITDADLGAVTPLSCDWQPMANTTVFAAACDDRSVHVLNVNAAKNALNVLFNISTNEHMPRGIMWTRNMWLIVAVDSGALYGWRLKSARSAFLSFRTLETESTDSEDESERLNDPQTLASCAPDPLPDVAMYGPRGAASVISFDRFSNQLLIGTSMGYIMFLEAGKIVPVAYNVSQMDTDKQIKSCLTNGEYAVAVSMKGDLKFFKYVRRRLEAEQVFKQQVRKCLQVVGPAALREEAEVDVELCCTVPSKNSTAPLCLQFMGSRQHVGLFNKAGGVRVFNIETGTELWSVKVNCVPLAVSVSEDGTLICLAVKTEANYPLAAYLDPEMPIGEVVIEVYEMLDGASIENFKFIKLLRTYETALSSLAVNGAGTLVAYAGTSNYVRVQRIAEAEDGAPSLVVDQQWSDHRTRVCDISWSLAGTKLISTSTHELFVWDVHALHRNIKLKTNHSGSNLFARFIYENVVISGGAEGLLNVHEVLFEDDDDDDDDDGEAAAA